MWKQARKKRTAWPFAVAACLLLLSAAVAGCLEEPDQEDSENGTGSPDDRDPFEPTPTSPRPEAVLSTDQEEIWAGENVTFDATASSAENGQIVHWRFEFGDGATFQTDNAAEATVEHTYTTGGVYVVNLTVEAEAKATADPDGDDETANETGSKQRADHTVSLIIAAHERFEVPETELDTGLIPETSMENHSFVVNEFAGNFTASLTIEAGGMLIDSDGTIRVLDPEGETVAEEEFTVSAGQQDMVNLTGDLEAVGTHSLEVELENGEITYSGSTLVHYLKVTMESNPEDTEGDS